MAKVFAVPRSETLSGYNEVMFTKGDNLNRGKTKSFRKWKLAVAFAREKAKEYGIKPSIHK